MHFKILPFLLLAPVASQAALFVYEGFDYGTSGAIHGTTATGTGLDGAYATTGTGSGGSATLTAGLGFSDRFFASKGGALQLSLTSASATQNETQVSGVRLNAGARTGTLYISHLFNLSSNSISASGDSIGLHFSDSLNGNRRLGILGDSGNSSNNAAVTYGAASSSQTGTSGTLALATGTTYLMIGEWTNVGGEGGGTATLWFLTSGQYDSWLDAGASLVALDLHATGKTSRSESLQVFINNDTFLRFSISEGSQDTTGTLAGVFDEFRMGTDLASVTIAIPEPGAAAALAAIAALLAGLVRRRRVR